MELCYEGGLVMPSSYAMMNEEEMTYVEGGSAHLPMNIALLNKGNCKTIAGSLISSKSVTGMSKQAIAEELFAHALLYYRAATINSVGISNGILSYITGHASVVDIEDGGDVWYRRAAYTALWYGNPSML